MDKLNLKQNSELTECDPTHTDQSELWSSDFQLQLAKLNFNNLKDLSLKRANNEELNVISSPIRLIDFEMLEAELLNQGILPKVPETLSQILIREVSHFKWTTRHFFNENTPLEFFIDVPLYLLKKAGQNLAISLTENTSIDFLSTQELAYFEQFAAYLLGEYEEANNSYEKGLNLILKTIKSGSSNNDLVEDLEKSITRVIFPFSQKALIKTLIGNNKNEPKVLAT